MKLRSLILILILSSILASCKKDDSPASPQFSIESEINATRPYHYVFIINPSAGNWTFEQGGTAPNNPFDDAYADHGFLIVVQSVGKEYFNLSLAKDIDIEPGSNGSTITLRY